LSSAYPHSSYQLTAEFIQGDHFIGQASISYKTGHTPHHATSFILNQNLTTSRANGFTAP
jgi:hypothetical protein